MKTSVIYGIGITIASALFTLALFFAGVHNDPAKMQSTGMVVGLVGFVIPIVGIVLALRSAREASPDGGLSYGRGVFIAFMVGVIAGVGGAIFNYVYNAIINPGMLEIVRQMQIEALEQKGMTQQQIDAASGVMRFTTNPVFTSIMAVIFTPVIYTIIGLIVAIFVRRQPVTPPEPPAAVA